MPATRLPFARLRSNFRLVRGLSTVVVLAPLWGCAGNPVPEGPSPDITGAYEFSGRVAGRFIEGAMVFPEPGGWMIRHLSGICDHTIMNADIQAFERQLRQGRVALSCGGFRLRFGVTPEGDIIGAEVVVTESETYMRPSGCAAYDSEGMCIEVRYVEATRSRTYRGPVQIRPAG